MARFHTIPERHAKGPVVVLVWDGFGISPKKEGNAIAQAKMPTWQKLIKTYPFSLLRADGLAVGLPETQPGNSEAGHETIGAGRAVESDQVRIDRAIADRSFFDNPGLLRAAAHCIRNKSTLHVMGLLTNGRSGHASPRHMMALLKFAEGMRLPRVAMHLFTDGRDTPPFHATHLISELEKSMPKNAIIASVMGRYYAMDRNKFWDRTSLAYDALAAGKGVAAESAIQAVTQAYNRGESDEFITPTVICKNNTCVAPIADHDAVVFWNLRSDRARQLSKPFVMRGFETQEPHAFHRSVIRKDVCFITLTEFGKDLDSVIAAFPNREVPGTIVEALRYHKQIYAAESEKFSQVTYFLNGGYDRPRFNEERLRVPSPRVANYERTPRMRTDELARKIVAALKGSPDFVLANFCNADIMGHSGNERAAILGCETLDSGLRVVWNAVHKANGVLIVTADHGNAEQMRNPHGGVDTEHNPNPVPFLIAGDAVKKRKAWKGTLADVAPTALWLLGVEKPAEMTGRNLLH